MKKQQRCRDGYCRMQQTFPATVILVFSLFCSASCHDNTMPSLHLNSMLTCRLVGGLTREQRAVCHEAPDAAAIAFEGLDLAVRECQHQFRWHRWNCSSLLGKSSNPHASGIMKRGFRETAFLYALASAGVAHAVARACAQGRLLSCGCDLLGYRTSHDTKGKVRPNKWEWSGCSHNLAFGLAFSHRFLDAREAADDLQSKINVHNNQAGRALAFGLAFSHRFLDAREAADDLQSKINVHNNQAGRAILASHMEVRCKCHGLSGSCQVRTCWRATPDFRVVASTIKRRYRNALIVAQEELNNGLSVLRGRPRGRRRSKARPASKTSLLFLEKSPSFCDADPRADSPGTSGRVCRTGRASRAGACATLCCGRGHALLRRSSLKPCNCTFHWCCRVDCDRCRDDKWVAVY